MGPPGGGKGTISKKILRDFSFSHLSTGDVLRENVRNATPVGVEAKSYMDAGDLVPDELMVRLVLSEVEEKGYNRLLLDGFPRTEAQAVELGKHIKVDMALNLDVPTETIVERISNRWLHPASGRVYAYDYNPPKVEGKDDETGEDLIQRDDDKADAVRTRLATYDKLTAPLIEYYRTEGVLKEFQGTESDVIYPMVKAYLEEQGQGAYRL
eukprot:CAMPEP_0205922466 /NCGR_PEP_ID=MMETSP1325-20131115/14534_1 /ASSEMBLY_ACC=CAM_ASM_000708 /TAXON_ID=236786 /ORGANISM="Florenciella sp., Strain RCC1007" /LENGTH=210 /DNA_ID=CAMNT_0053290479 /DNA_START=173 /DNA_END=805 /DNA_ORIENTATION=+